MADLEAEVEEVMYMDESDDSAEPATAQQASLIEQTQIVMEVDEDDFESTRVPDASARTQEVQTISHPTIRTVSDLDERVAENSRGEFHSGEISPIEDFADETHHRLLVNPIHMDRNLFDGPMTPRNNIGPFVLDGNHAAVVPERQDGVRVPRPSGPQRSLSE